MDDLSNFLYKLSIYASGVGFIVGITLFITLPSKLANVHINVKLLYYFIIFAGISSCAIQIISAVLILDEKILIYNDLQVVYLFAVYFIRSTDLALSCERLVATCFPRHYETKRCFLFLGPFFLGCSTILACILGPCVSATDVPFYVRYPLILICDFSSLCLIQILAKRNRHQRILSNSQHVPLSYKYQLVENIRVLKLLRIQSIVILIYGIFGNLLGICRYGMNNYHLARSIGYLCNVILVVVSSAYWANHSPVVDRFIYKFMKSSNVMPEFHAVVGTFGFHIKTHQTLDEHINQLQNAWK